MFGSGCVVSVLFFSGGVQLHRYPNWSSSYFRIYGGRRDRCAK
jgi:hypothetical protein